MSAGVVPGRCAVEEREQVLAELQALLRLVDHRHGRRHFPLTMVTRGAGRDRLVSTCQRARALGGDVAEIAGALLDVLRVRS